MQCDSSEQVVSLDGHDCGAVPDHSDSGKLCDTDNHVADAAEVVCVKMGNNEDNCADDDCRRVACSPLVTPVGKCEQYGTTEQGLFEHGYLQVVGDVIGNRGQRSDCGRCVDCEPDCECDDGHDYDGLEDSSELILGVFDSVVSGLNHVNDTHRIESDDTTDDNENGLNGLGNGIRSGYGEHCTSPYESDDGTDGAACRFREREAVSHDFYSFLFMLCFF